MTTLTLSNTKIEKGLGCLNGLSCPNCKSPLVDTLSGETKDRKLKDCYCPMCEFTGSYNRFTKTVKATS